MQKQTEAYPTLQINDLQVAFSSVIGYFARCQRGPPICESWRDCRTWLAKVDAARASRRAALLGSCGCHPHESRAVRSGLRPIRVGWIP